MRAKRFFGTFLPAKKVWICRHNLMLDQGRLECPKCEAERAAKRLLARLRRGLAEHREDEA